MATRIIEYGGADRVDGMQVVPKSIAVQTPLTATGVSQQSAAFSSGTTFICIQTDEIIHEARGASPTATISNYKIRAAAEQFFSVNPGDKVAIITGT